MANLPRVALILTGGTIDSVGKDRLDLAWYIEAGKRLNDGELLQQLPELKSIAEVQEIPFRRLPSHALIDKDNLKGVPDGVSGQAEGHGQAGDKPGWPGRRERQDHATEQGRGADHRDG